MTRQNGTKRDRALPDGSEWSREGCRNLGMDTLSDIRLFSSVSAALDLVDFLLMRHFVVALYNVQQM